ncbi:hypothetical protein KPATCC21470_4546 [Kitasatospora purpeofusca]
MDNLGTTALFLGTTGGQPGRPNDGPPVVHSLWTTVVHKSTGT